MTSIANGINTSSPGEYNLIAERTLTASDDTNYPITGGNVTDQKLWPISYDEWDTISDNTVRSFGNYFWLRSPYDTDYAWVGPYAGGGRLVSLVNRGGNAVRPAFSLNLSSVLFTSAAAGGKSSAVGAALEAAQPPTGAVKLTVFDDVNLSLASTATIGTVAPGTTVSLPYTAVQTGANRYVSCVITNTSGDVLYYGKLANATSASGTATFTVPATLADGNYTLRLFNEEINGNNYTDFASTPENISMTVKAGAVAPNITTTTLAGGTVGTAYTQTLAATGDMPITWSVDSGSLPAGLSLNTSTGEISGTPTTAGSSTFTIKASNGVNPDDTETYTVVIAAAPVALTFTDSPTFDIPASTVGTAITSIDVSSGVSGGTMPYTFGAAGLPAGITIDPATGIISGTPTAAGVAGTATITVTDNVGATQSITIDYGAISASGTGVAPIITSGDSLTLYLGMGGFFQVTATGTPAPTYSLSNAPIGVTIDATTGRIIIAPTTRLGTHTFTITASNGIDPPATQTFTLTIMMPMASPVIMSPGSINIVYGEGGTFQVSASGNPAPTYSLSGAPSGVTIDANTGLITIAATVKPGTYTFTIIASNGIDPDARQTFTLTVGKVSDVPKTGDNFPLEWLTLAFVVLVGSAALLLKAPETKKK